MEHHPTLSRHTHLVGTAFLYIAKVRPYLFLFDTKKNNSYFSFPSSGLLQYYLNLITKKGKSVERLVQNAAAFSMLTCLNWLPVSFRIDFKIPLLVYKAVNTLAPPQWGHETSQPQDITHCSIKCTNRSDKVRWKVVFILAFIEFNCLTLIVILHFRFFFLLHFNECLLKPLIWFKLL